MDVSGSPGDRGRGRCGRRSDRVLRCGRGGGGLSQPWSAQYARERRLDRCASARRALMPMNAPQVCAAARRRCPRERDAQRAIIQRVPVRLAPHPSFPVAMHGWNPPNYPAVGMPAGHAPVSLSLRDPSHTFRSASPCCWSRFGRARPRARPMVCQIWRASDTKTVRRLALISARPASPYRRALDSAREQWAPIERV